MAKNTKKDKQTGKKREYEVGKNKPPLHTRFSSERQPEKNGRPPGVVNWKTLYNQLLSLPAPETLLAEIKKVNPGAKLIQDIVTINTFNRALKGNPKAMELLHYYAGDKPTETIVHEGNDEKPINIKLTGEALQKELVKRGLDSIKLFDE